MSRPVPSPGPLLALIMFAAGCESTDPGQQSLDAGVDASRGSPAAVDAPLRIEPSAGPIVGMQTNSLRAFLGIPYAEPPVGELRFRAPVARAPWSEDLDATTIPTPCVQREIAGVGQGDENCLTLDVWTPRSLPPDPLPVMFWIHGGGFTAGSGFLAEPALAAEGVVLVAINYRLGPLGFLVHPDPDVGAAGNQAIRDQLLALRWVQENIAAFGGDADDVTVFGESAGGSAVCALLVTPDARDLFHRAIVMSGTLCGREPIDFETAGAQGDDLARAAGCEGDDVGTCLRELPATEFPGLLQGRTVIAPGAAWEPVPDGDLFPRSFVETFAQGDIQRVPTMIGSTAQEGLGFVLGLGDIDEAEYRELVESSPSMAEHAEAVLEQYPASDYPSPLEAFAALTGHRVFDCRARRGARAIAATGVPVRMYLYDHPPAFHASELIPLFGSPPPPDDQVGDVLKALWVGFARDGVPGAPGLVDWPAYTREETSYLRIRDAPAVQTDLLRAECDFWDGLQR